MDFSHFSRQSQQRFKQYHQLLKSILMGKTTLCPVCHKAITLRQTPHMFQLHCAKGCTDIELERE